MNKSQTWTPEKRALDEATRAALEALETMIDHASETFPHFESARGQRDIAAAAAASDALAFAAAHILPDERDGSQMDDVSRVTDPPACFPGARG